MLYDKIGDTHTVGLSFVIQYKSLMKQFRIDQLMRKILQVYQIIIHCVNHALKLKLNKIIVLFRGESSSPSIIIL